MSEYVEKARALRASTEKRYNCSQAVVVPFAAAAGLTEDQAYRAAGNFGGGLKMASTCGAIVGGLMVLALCGVDDAPSVGEYYAALRRSHGNVLDCASLLRINRENGGEKKPHCDAMVYECVALAERLLRERGRLP